MILKICIHYIYLVNKDFCINILFIIFYSEYLQML
jgi:hypothetical protein